MFSFQEGVKKKEGRVDGRTAAFWTEILTLGKWGIGIDVAHLFFGRRQKKHLFELQKVSFLVASSSQRQSRRR
jgi:hypothetical protein